MSLGRAHEQVGGLARQREGVPLGDFGKERTSTFAQEERLFELRKRLLVSCLVHRFEGRLAGVDFGQGFGRSRSRSTCVPALRVCEGE